jgi:hypothetical protein
MGLVLDGKSDNIEDLVISYALKEPYRPRHGDDLKPRINAYAAQPSGVGTGLNEAPPTPAQPVPAWRCA